MRIVVILSGLLLVSPNFAHAQLDVPPPPMPTGVPSNQLPPTLTGPRNADEEGMETQTQGPFHDAFATPPEADPQPSPIVTEKPPADVPEQPPEYKPDGDFIWIPGYFEWDDDRRGFIWVTGVWRQPPPGKRWMPGYWEEVEGGWQRVKGFWVDEAVENVTYYDTPPTSLETGPSSPQPADNFFWIPGNWNYQNTDFVWQAGYWAPYQTNWVWVPSRWVWTPAGFVFLPGHWDYRLANRGQIFAPVVFTTTVYRPGWFYRPTVVIPTNNLFVNLWIRPGHGCYYFGNYYGPQYANLGLVSWCHVGAHHRGRYIYDPFYSYAHVHYHRQGVDFVGRVRGWHDYYHDHPEDRSPRTWREQQQWMASRGNNRTAVLNLTAHHVSDTSRHSDAPFKVAKLDERTRNVQVQHVKQLHDLNSARKNIEHEHARVTTRITGDATRNRDRDGDKTSPLVDRIEKGKKSGDTQTLHTTAPVNLKLPKVDLPTSAKTAIRNSGGKAATVLGDNPPPLPKGGRNTVVTKDSTDLPRSNVLPNSHVLQGKTGTVLQGKTGTSGTGQSSTFGQKTGGVTTGEIGKKIGELRGGANDLPGNIGNTGQGKARSGKTTGSSDDSTGRLNNIPNIPNVQLPGNVGDLPNVRLPGGKNDLPKTGTSGGTGGGKLPRSGAIDGVPRGGKLPTGGNDLQGGQGGGKSTIRNFQPPGNTNSGGGNQGTNSSSGSNKGKKKSDDK